MKAISILLLAAAAPAAAFQPSAVGSARVRGTRVLSARVWWNPFTWDESEAPVPKTPKITSIADGFKGISEEAKAMPPLGKGLRAAPHPEQTGLPVDIVRACASLSQQIYNVESKDDFKLSTGDYQVDLIAYDNHGALDATNPAFAVAVAGDTLIAGWRGTNKLADAATDLAFAPVLDMSWFDKASELRAHAAITATVGSDLLSHMETIIKEVEARDLKRVVFTGHSLGGGMAQVANLYASARSNFPDVEIRTCAFAGVMTVLDVGDADKATQDFVNDVKERSCNIMYGQDIVSRLPGYMTYLDECVTDVLPKINEMIKKEVPVPGFIYEFVNVDERLQTAYEGGKKNPKVTELTHVAARFRQISSLVYYDDATAEPIVLEDQGEHVGSTEPCLSHYPYKPTDDPITTLLDAHLYFPKALAYNVIE